MTNPASRGILAILAACLLLACEPAQNAADRSGSAGKLVLDITAPVATRPVGYPVRVWMHYMPWFDSPSSGRGWGWHWRMNTRNPDVIVDEATGKRQIASHYYPLIGPYSSGDDAVLEYHLLLMKYAGVSGVLIDWYGSRSVSDYGINLGHANALAERLSRYGLDFAAVYEDWTTEFGGVPEVERIGRAKLDMEYLENNYFARTNYLTLDGRKLLLVFGPRTFTRPPLWAEILSTVDASPLVVPLCYRKDDIGTEAEFMWPYQDGRGHLSHLASFYERAPSLETAIGVAYPGFRDYYREGGAGDGYFVIDHLDGAVFDETLALAAKEGLAYLQIATWNDFGEGTMVEPTFEFQFDFLRRLQVFTSAAHGAADLVTIFKLYKARTQYAGDASVRDLLDDCADHLEADRPGEAAEILDRLAVDPTPFVSW